ncbi:hypothetical protein Patl1_24191 [Pistacia atlantica]|uniref:Uncharacterized protein n=1 Tax=Pistacia atlantica TaxID=434234 RepID=A0ACC0ZXG8_9ROSI|nr:hypothetical protein Patl1_24191 [Pistacia atlantica]
MKLKKTKDDMYSGEDLLAVSLGHQSLHVDSKHKAINLIRAIATSRNTQNGRKAIHISEESKTEQSTTPLISTTVKLTEINGKLATVKRIKLGSQGLEVSAQGLGCMGMSAFYGPPKPEPEMIALIHHAINSGITFLDTSDLYGPHTNEILLGKIDARKDLDHPSCSDVHLGVGVRICAGQYSDDKGRINKLLTNPNYGELKKLVEEGIIKYIGLSEACVSIIRRAHAVHPITAVQLEWSLWARDVEEEICSYLQKLPKLQPENLDHNKKLFECVHEIAAKKGCTTSQLALAWVHYQGADVCPIPGITKIENFNQNIKALSVKLTPEEVAELESIAAADAVKGERYKSGFATYKNSETPPLSSWKAS